MNAMTATMGCSDAEVVERVRSGDTASYEILMRRYNQRLFRIARAIVATDADAEDALQNAYLQAYLHLGQFRGEAAFSTWLTRIAIRQALALRRRGPEEGLSGEVTTMRDTSAKENPEDNLMQKEIGALIERAVDRLPEQYRIVFVMREIENLTTAETAESLDISEENVKVRLHRSRAMLQRDLYEHAGSAVAKAFAFDGKRCDRIVAGVFGRIATVMDPVSPSEDSAI